MYFFQVPSETEKKVEKILLGNIYNDKEFLRTIYEKCDDNEGLKEISEEGFCNDKSVLVYSEQKRRDEPNMSKLSDDNGYTV